jgi:hypothetical protein
VHINRKRQFDSQSALDAQSSAQQAKPTRRAEGTFSLQRWALACFGVLGTASLLAIAGCPANLEDPARFNVVGLGGAAAGGAAPAGGAAGGGTKPTGVDFTAASKVFTTSCATSAICHTAGSTTGLDLVSPGVEQRLVNVNAMHMLSGATDCPMVKLIDTATPMKSWLLSKVTPGAFGDCGALMPFAAATPLSAADLATITKLVNDEAAAASGAPPPPAGTGGAAATTAGSGGM